MKLVVDADQVQAGDVLILPDRRVEVTKTDRLFITDAYQVDGQWQQGRTWWSGGPGLVRLQCEGGAYNVVISNANCVKIKRKARRQT